MPAIAQGAANDHAAFYWHLGDLRAGYDFDEDLLKAAEKDGKKLRISDYVGNADGTSIGAWDDFKQSQIAPFQTLHIPFFLGIGNHETIWPQSRERFTKYFTAWLDMPELKDQRLYDLQKHAAPDSGAKTYYHWIVGPIDFIYLDNASKDQFDADQIRWFEEVLKDDRDPRNGIAAVVVGMHAALPNSLSDGHSMNQANDGGASGVQVYKDLLDLRDNGKKQVYVLASHSHFFMDGVYKTIYWRDHGGQLPGWIIGTAGAVRYSLPPDHSLANASQTYVYGYLSGTVSNGAVKFDFHEIKESDIPPQVLEHYGPAFVHDTCFVGNRE